MNPMRPLSVGSWRRVAATASAWNARSDAIESSERRTTVDFENRRVSCGPSSVYVRPRPMASSGNKQVAEQDRRVEVEVFDRRKRDFRRELRIAAERLERMPSAERLIGALIPAGLPHAPDRRTGLRLTGERPRECVRHAHRSSHPNGRSSSRSANARLSSRMSRRAAAMRSAPGPAWVASRKKSSSVMQPTIARTTGARAVREGR